MKGPRKTKPKARPINPKDVFNQAIAFAFSDKWLRQSGTPTGVLQITAVPSMVLSSFATELFLKCILLLDGQDVPSTHRLDLLFRQLSNKRKKRISELWAEHVKANPHIYAHTAAPRPIPDNLRDCLKECRDAFVLLRYAYEDRDKVIFYMGEFAYVLHAAIIEIKPEWRPPTPPTSQAP
jgi:hypothetical protein